MRRKTSGSVTASVVLCVSCGMLASVLGVRQYDRATTEPAWVAKSALAAGQVITPAVLEKTRVSSESQAITDTRLLIGKQLRSSKQAGDFFSSSDLQQRQIVQSTLAQQVPAGRVVYSLQLAGKASIPYSQLRGGDRLDVLVRGRAGVRTAAVDVRLIGVIKPRSRPAVQSDDSGVIGLLPQKRAAGSSTSGATSLVLAVHPKHVYPLASISAKEDVSLVLHSAQDSADKQSVSITPKTTRRDVEVLSGLARSSVSVRR